MILNYTLYYFHPVYGYLPFASFKWISDTRQFYELMIKESTMQDLVLSEDSGKTFISAKDYFATLEQG